MAEKPFLALKPVAVQALTAKCNSRVAADLLSTRRSLPTGVTWVCRVGAWASAAPPACPCPGFFS